MLSNKPIENTNLAYAYMKEWKKEKEERKVNDNYSKLFSHFRWFVHPINLTYNILGVK